MAVCIEGISEVDLTGSTTQHTSKEPIKAEGRTGRGLEGFWDKMIRTKWYGQNGTHKMVRIKRYR